MPTRLRKVRKHRGSRSHGWGQSAGHRSAGSLGGFGQAGGRKHKWTYTVSHEPNRFGKHGFYRQGKRATTINVGEVDQLVDELLANGQAIKKGERIFVDLEALNVDKLLGSGRVNHPLLIRVKAFSSAAVSKIQEAKGQILRLG